ncbi:hypothetical protein SAMN02799622_01096 [Methylobacterium sp. UNC378MF]|nr:hypothetical protein SAMN02799622_01096 [Methylobacterium sp. UNC378MF]
MQRPGRTGTIAGIQNRFGVRKEGRDQTEQVFALVAGEGDQKGPEVQLDFGRVVAGIMENMRSPGLQVARQRPAVAPCTDMKFPSDPWCLFNHHTSATWSDTQCRFNRVLFRGET